jgi:hypothetical protein
LEGYRTDGPFSNPENYKRLNLFWKGTQDFSPSSKLTILATSFESSWYGSGLLPSRAVEEGLISQWDSIDPSQGGKTERQNLSATYHSEIADGQNLEVQAYYTRYILQLFSNFTFFLNNPANGDGIEQDDNRNMFGGHVQYTGMVPLDAGIWTTTVGLESRNDENHPDLWNEEDRERISPILLSDTWERTLGIYVKEEVPLTSRLRFVGGLRYDHGNFDANGASGTDAIISPKGNLIFAASPNMDLFVNAGSGYHSNDPRTVATDPSSGFVRAVGLETGAQVRTLEDRLTASLAFWGMDVDSELVFDGDTGTTEPSGPSRRMGIENEWSYQLNRWLHADLDINLADAKYRGTDGSVPLAMNQYFTGGLTAHSNSGLEGSLRFRDVGRRWGDDDRQVPIEGYAVVDTMVSYRRGHWGYQLAVDNIADTTWRDGQFVYLSQLKSDPAPVTDVIFTPGNPRTILGSVKYFF